MNASDSPSLSRREALKILGTTAAVAGLGVHRLAAAETASSGLGWDLPKLPYAYGALEPHFDARTMEIHHAKHHQAYITNALGQVTAQEYDQRANLIRVTDPKGNVTQYFYDEEDRRTMVLFHDGTTIRTVYDALG